MPNNRAAMVDTIKKAKNVLILAHVINRMRVIIQRNRIIRLI
jgi:hypothetical protein